MDATFLLLAAAKAAALAALTVAAVVDLRRRIIPNGAVLAVMGAGLLLQLHDFDLEGFATSAVVAFLLLAGMGLLARRGIVGGGDAKLIAAASLLQPAAAVPTVLVYIALAGGALAVAYLIRQWLSVPKLAALPSGVSDAVNTSRSLPYGVAVALGVVSFNVAGIF